MASAAPRARPRSLLAGLGVAMPERTLLLPAAAAVALWAAATTAVLTSIPEFRVTPAPASSRVGATSTAVGAASVPRAPVVWPVEEGMRDAGEPAPVVPPGEAMPAEPPATSLPVVDAASAPPVLQIIGAQGLITAGPRGGPLNTQGADLYDCSDFSSFEQMLAVFIASGLDDPNRLDPAKTGMPCS